MAKVIDCGGIGLAKFYGTVSHILLCTHDPMLVKSLYGVLRDAGHDVEVTDHPAHAVRLAMQNSFLAVIMDTAAFGLSVRDAVDILRSFAPELQIILVGRDAEGAGATDVTVPHDLEDLQRLVCTMQRTHTITHH